MRQHRTKNNNLILPNAPSQLFQDWQTNQETRYSQRQLCLHCRGIAENQESHHNRNSEALKNKICCRCRLLLIEITFYTLQRANGPFWHKKKLYRTLEDLKTCQNEKGKETASCEVIFNLMPF